MIRIALLHFIGLGLAESKLGQWLPPGFNFASELCNQGIIKLGLQVYIVLYCIMVSVLKRLAVQFFCFELIK